MGNERLRHQMRVCGKTATDLAAALAVDPKTVLRWIDTGRQPQSKHRQALAELLEADEAFLWPQVLDDPRSSSHCRSELRAIYPTRASVPAEVWRRLIESAQVHVDVLVYAGLFLVDTNPDMPLLFVERAGRGLRGRFLYGNPDSEAVAARGAEEGIGDDLAARVRLTLTYMSPILGVEGLEVREHESILYNSIYRFDDEMLVNTHVLGSPASQNPVLHIERVSGGQLFDHYTRSFERVWDVAKPLEPLVAA